MRKKGTPKTGGRTKGTPNKSTTELKQWINDLIDQNKEVLENDLKNLEPTERWRIMEKLLTYIIPKQQSISIEAQAEAEMKALNELMEDFPEEAIDAISSKLIAYHKQKNT